MPRYAYKCEDCEHSQLHLVSMSFVVGECPVCSSTNYVKQLNIPAINTGKVIEKELKVGDKTKEFIEANREVLKDLKQNNKGKVYESS